MSTTRQYLRRPEFTAKQALDAPITDLVAVTEEAAEVLDKAMQIKTIQDLAESTHFQFAEQVAKSLAAPEHIFRKFGIPVDRVTKGWENRSASDISDADIDALEGIGSKRRQEIERVLGVKTIQELAEWPPFKYASAILEEATFASNGGHGFVLWGSVIDEVSKLPGLNLQVEISQSTEGGNHIVDRAMTDLNGRFECSLSERQCEELFGGRRPELLFTAYYGEKPLDTNSGKVHWFSEGKRAQVSITAHLEGILGWRVSGRVRTKQGTFVPEIRIQAFAQQLLKAPVLLGTGTTDNRGHYVIEYGGAAQQILETSNNIDLFVTVADEPRLRSDIVIDARQQSVIDLVVPIEKRPRPTVFETLDSKIQSVLNCVDFEQINEDDIHYLSSKLELESASVSRVIYANRLAKESEKLSPSVSLPADIFFALRDQPPWPELQELANSPKSALARALNQAISNNEVRLKQGKTVGELIDQIKSLAADLLLKNRSNIHESVMSSLAELTNLELADQQEFVRTYVANEKSTEHFWRSLETKPEWRERVSDLKSLLALDKLVEGHVPLIRAIRDEALTPSSLTQYSVTEWEQLLTQKDIPLPVGSTATNDISAYAKHLKNRFYEAFPTLALIHGLRQDALIPQDRKPNDELFNFVVQYPELVIGKTPVNRFLNEYEIYDKFAIELENIEDATERNERRERQQQLFRQLRHIELACALVPDRFQLESISAILSFDLPPKPVPPQPRAIKYTGSGKKHWPPLWFHREGRGEDESRPQRRTTSTVSKATNTAAKIALTNRSVFIHNWQKHRARQANMNEKQFRTEAETIYARACYLTFRLSLNAWNASGALESVVPELAVKANRQTTKALVKVGWSSQAVADLETLFGTPSFCECVHCQSIYSPAAYLAQLWQDITEQHDLVNLRRPDIAALELTCNNTLVKLPYIDLVLEALEQLFFFGWNTQINVNRQTTRTEKELALQPEHEDARVYALLSGITFPFEVPWDKWFAEARLYLNYMGLPLHRLVECFLPMEEAAVVSSDVAYHWTNHRTKQLSNLQATRANLGFTVSLHDLVTLPIVDSGEPSTYLHFGDDLRPLFNVKTVDEAKPLSVFMARLGWWTKNHKENHGREQFTLLRELLGCRYIQDSRVESTAAIDIEFKGSPCDANSAELRNLTKDTLIRIVKFEHLRRTLGWQPRELNQAIVNFSNYDLTSNTPLSVGALNSDLLTKISHLIRLQARSPTVGVMEILSWWADIETGSSCLDLGPWYEREKIGEDSLSLYERVFLHHSLFGSDEQHATRAFFVLNESRTDLAYLDSMAPRPLEEFSGSIAAALRIKASEFFELIAFLSAMGFSTANPLPLRLSTLSGLYRIVSLCRLVDISLREFVLVYRLLESAYEPFSEDTGKTVLFVEAIEQIKRSPFTIRDLAYLWHHHTDSERELVYIAEQTENLTQRLKEELGGLFSSPASFFELDDRSSSAIVQNLLNTIGYPQSIAVSIIEALQTSSAAQILQQKVRILSVEQITSIEQLAPGSDALYAAVISALHPFQATAIALLQNLADFSGLPLSLSNSFASHNLGSATQDEDCLIDAFLRAIAGEAVDNAILTDHLLRLNKFAAVVDRFKLDASEVEYITDYSECFHSFAFSSLPIHATAANKPTFTQWASIERYVMLRGRIALDKPHLIDIFLAANHARDTQNSAERTHWTNVVFKNLAALLGIEAKELRSIAATLRYFEDSNNSELRGGFLTNADSMLPLIELIEATRRCGRSIQALSPWVSEEAEDGTALTLDAAWSWPDISSISEIVTSNTLEYKQRVVDDIRNAVQALSSDTVWNDLARKQADTLRLLKRDKLLDTIISSPFYQLTGPEFAHASQVYDFILLDPLMNSCMYTTRLKQAISAIQLLIQRTFMGLEGDQHRESLKESLGAAWEWKKNYRVWEAQQKILLYPENWIEPELRDDKSPFFEEFESKLAQSDIDERSIESALKSYLAKLEDVAQLEAATFKQQIESFTIVIGDIVATVSWADDLHVIGRSREKPRTYYYRKRNMNGIWKPWSRIDLDIESDLVLLTIFNGRPHIFWPSVKEKVQKLGQDNSDDKNNDKTNYRPYVEIYLNWSRYEDRRWTPKKRSESPSVLMYEWNSPVNPEHAVTYDVVSDEDGVTVNLSIIGTDKSVDRYSWNEDKLSELLLTIKNLPNEIDWEYMMPGWDLFKAGGITQNHVDLITEKVAQIIDYTEKQLKINLYKHPQHSSPFSFITSKIIDYRTSFGVEYAVGALATFLFWIPAGFRNKSDGFGLASNDARKVASALRDLHNVASSQGIGVRDEDIELFDNRYRCLQVTNDAKSNNALLTFSRVRFDGYKLKPKVTNSLGLWEVEYPNGDNVDQGLRVILGSKSLEDAYPITNTAALSNVTAEDNHLTIHKTNATYNVELKSRTSAPSELEFQALHSPGGVVWDTGVRSHYFFYDTRGTYFFRASNEAGNDNYLCDPFFHPDARQYSEILDKENLGRPSDRARKLLDIENHQNASRQLTINRIDNFEFAEQSDRTSFLLTMPYGAYNWEVFFHIPFTVAVRLSQNKKFEQAQEWFHHIFNPLQPISVSGENYTDNSTYDPSHYWHFLPLHRLGLPPEVTREELDAMAEEVAKDPFQPHRIARSRHGAYQKAVVMKYLDNLIAWGDDLFSHDTIESINEAAHLYLLAAKILGQRPIVLPRRHVSADTRDERGQGGSALTLTRLTPYSHKFAQIELGAETPFAGILQTVPMESASSAISQISTAQRYIQLADNLSENLNEVPAFCIPHNDKLLSYWDTVADRLFSIRNCRNIAGESRELPIFEPPIDPGFLVRGRALGVDISELLSDLYTPLPPYRFRFMLQKAMDFAADVQRLGSSLLSVIEKRDAEELSLLRSKHERALLKANEKLRRLKIDENREGVKAAHKARDAAEAKLEYYGSRTFENQNERAQVAKLDIANGFNIAGQITSLAASVAYGFPNFHQNTFNGSMNIESGGRFIGDALTGMSRFLSMLSNIYSHEASMHAIQGGRERRMDDWTFQTKQAKIEKVQFERQLLASEVQLAMAERELEIHQTQQEQATEIRDFFLSKFSNRDLFDWMISQTSQTYFQSYKMALDLARMAEKCYRRERRQENSSFIGHAYWDNLKKGLLAGEQLQFDLRRMEAEYYQTNKRELEMTKSISLRQLAPLQLDDLRFRGSCEFDVPEFLFDLDCPGHYQRRIKSLRVSVPAVKGPHTVMGLRLTLLDSSTKQLDGTLRPDGSVPVIKSITLSSGRDDGGMFELNHNDERYLPFELCGVNSHWKAVFLSDYASFDRSSISDLILELSYTALEDGSGDLLTHDNQNVAAAYNDASQAGPRAIGQRIDLRRDFTDTWHRFRETGDISLTIDRNIFPYLVQPVIDRVRGIAVMAQTNVSIPNGFNIGSFRVENEQSISEESFLYCYGPGELPSPITLRPAPDPAPTLNLSVDRNTVDPKVIQELIVVLFYELAEPQSSRSG